MKNSTQIQEKIKVIENTITKLEYENKRLQSQNINFQIHEYKELTNKNKNSMDKQLKDIKEAKISIEDKIGMILSRNCDYANANFLFDVSQRTFTVDEIRVELESIDEFKAAKYFFDEYGG